MKVLETRLPGVLIIEPKVFGDERGFFVETFQQSRYADMLNTDLSFVQDNFSRSQRGVLRGLHFQVSKPQGKLVSCSRGQVFDVAADIDPDSETFGQYVGVMLDDKDHRQLWVPPGYAHGFCVVSDTADFKYKCTDYYDPTDEGGIIWNDETLNIDWPEIGAPRLSDKDLKLPTLIEYAEGKRS
ncbi:dTDP-4-dehydrorhamnose 3,5-epimerase [Allohahella sp. A8]|uniref:dTDP-4-dehydrorhamnose 3,5-epimerase n=1 Tax=Allohahella sp. A8 TaxID=3141461 RepID=UPI003A810CE0